MYKSLPCVVVLLCACEPSAGDAMTIVEGTMVSIAEGEALELHVTTSAQITSQGVPWAALATDGRTLTLAPDCGLVPGTDGAPKLFELVLQAQDGSASTTVLVQVRPSGAGACRPHVIACKSTKPCSISPPCTEDAAVPNLRVDFTGSDPDDFSDLTRPDDTITYTLINPDPSDRLEIRIVSDAPAVVGFRNGNTLCTTIPNTNIIGDFTVSYIIGRLGPDQVEATAASEIVDSGAYPLSWNTTQPFGAEVAWCGGTVDPLAPSTPSCMVTRPTDPTDPGFAGWCVRKKNGVNLTLGLRIWNSLPKAMASFDLDVQVANSTSLAAPMQKAVSGPIKLLSRPPKNQPYEVVADVGSTDGPWDITVTRTVGMMVVTNLLPLTRCP